MHAPRQHVSRVFASARGRTQFAMRTTAACVMRGVLLVAAASCALATTERPLGVVVQTQEAEALTVAADMPAVFDQWRATFGKAYSQGEQVRLLRMRRPRCGVGLPGRHKERR